MFKFFEKRRREKAIIKETLAENEVIEMEFQNKKNFDAFIQQSTAGKSYDGYVITTATNLFTPFHMQYIQNATKNTIMDAASLIYLSFNLYFNEYELYIYQIITVFSSCGDVEFFPKDSELDNGKVTLFINTNVSELQYILLDPEKQKILECCPLLLQDIVKILSEYTPDIFRDPNLNLLPYNESAFPSVKISEDGRYSYDEVDSAKRRLYLVEWHLRTDRGKELFELTSGLDSVNYASINTEDYGYLYFISPFDEDFNHPDVIPIVDTEEEDDRVYTMEELLEKFPDQIL